MGGPPWGSFELLKRLKKSIIRKDVTVITTEYSNKRYICGKIVLGKEKKENPMIKKRINNAFFAQSHTFHYHGHLFVSLGI